MRPLGWNLVGSRTVRLAAVIIILCAALLRTHRLDFKSLDADEVFTVAIGDSDNSLLDVLSIPLHNTPTAKPAFYFLVTHFFLRLEDHDFLLRFPSLAFGVLGVAATYAVGTKLFGRKEGLTAAFLLCISPLHVRYSQMARFYPLLMTFSLLSLYFLYRTTFVVVGRVLPNYPPLTLSTKVSFRVGFRLSGSVTTGVTFPFCLPKPGSESPHQRIPGQLPWEGRGLGASLARPKAQVVERYTWLWIHPPDSDW